MINNNVHSIFINKLLDSNRYYKNKEFTVLSKYIDSHSYIVVKNKYGKLKALPTNLLKNKKLTIRSAINKTEYWISMAKEVHNDSYSYNEVVYESSTTKLEKQLQKNNKNQSYTPKLLFGGIHECFKQIK